MQDAHWVIEQSGPSKTPKLDSSRGSRLPHRTAPNVSERAKRLTYSGRPPKPNQRKYNFLLILCHFSMQMNYYIFLGRNLRHEDYANVENLNCQIHFFEKFFDISSTRVISFNIGLQGTCSCFLLEKTLEKKHLHCTTLIIENNCLVNFSPIDA